jgi:hypothetical protein
MMKLIYFQRISRGKESPKPFKGRAPLAASLMLGALLFSCKEHVSPPAPAPRPVQKVSSSSGDGPYYKIFTEPPAPLPKKAHARAPVARKARAIQPSARQQPPSETQIMGELRTVADLRAAGFDGAAESISSRVNQQKPKMKLSQKQASKIVTYFQRFMPSMPKTRKLHSYMPRSTVELVRAVGERGVSREEAEKISSFLIYFTNHMQFRNLKQLDANTSHVIGREWKQIDFSGERTNWRRQKNHWSKYGVVDFQHAVYVCKYFLAASKYRFFRRIYKARRGLPGDMDEHCR